MFFLSSSTLLITLYRCFNPVHACTCSMRNTPSCSLGVYACDCKCEPANCFKRTCVLNTTAFPWIHKAQRDHTDIVFPAWLGRQADCKLGPWWISKPRHSCKTLRIDFFVSLFFRGSFIYLLFFATIKVWSVLAITKHVPWLWEDHLRWQYRL